MWKINKNRIGENHPYVDKAGNKVIIMCELPASAQKYQGKKWLGYVHLEDEDRVEARTYTKDGINSISKSNKFEIVGIWNEIKEIEFYSEFLDKMIKMPHFVDPTKLLPNNYEIYFLDGLTLRRLQVSYREIYKEELMKNGYFFNEQDAVLWKRHINGFIQQEIKKAKNNI